MAFRISRKVALAIAIVAGMIILLIVIINQFKSLFIAMEDNIPSTFQLLEEHKMLISDKYRNALSVDEVFQNKERNPISFLNYDSGYRLIIYKMELKKIQSLKKILRCTNNKTEVPSAAVYRILKVPYFFLFKFKTGKAELATTFNLNLDGDSLSVLKVSDSLYYYHLRCKNLSISYTKDSLADIFVGGDEKMPLFRETIPMDLAFLIRNNNLYFLMMTPKKSGEGIDENLLLKLIG